MSVIDTNAKSYQPPVGGYEQVPLECDEIKVAAVQMRAVPINPDNPKPGLKRNVDIILRLSEQAAQEGCKLIVFPEFSLVTGEGSIAGKWTREQFIRVCPMVPGPETEAIGAKAKEHKCYIMFMAYSQERDWPGHFFNASITVGPSGDVILNHWKAYYGQPGTGAGYATTVYDVLDEFVERYGWDAVWPVARTPIGNFAGYICSEGFNPEVSRMYAFNGAEILCRQFGGGGKGLRRGKYPILFRGDCAGNMVWGVYANTASPVPGDPETSTSGSSMVVSPCGEVLAEAKGIEEEMVTATIPIAQFRKDTDYHPGSKYHLTPGTIKGGVRTDIIVPIYQRYPCAFPPNLLTEYQKQHNGQLPPDKAATREWYLKNTRWELR